MHAPSAQELFAAWEEGVYSSLEHRALILLAKACPEQTRDDLELLPVGRRDEALLELRSLIFGPDLKGIVTCPSCSERLELRFTVGDVRTSVRDSGAGGDEQTMQTGTVDGKSPGALSLRREGYEILFRLPTSRDMAAIDHATGTGSSRMGLLTTCIVSVFKEGQEILPDELPDDIVAEIARMMGEADPHADVRVDVICPSCSHQWEHFFDIVPYFWTEIDVWALRTLAEVHILATRYGWSEREILGMSSWKRQRYIELVEDR